MKYVTCYDIYTCFILGAWKECVSCMDDRLRGADGEMSRLVSLASF